MARRRMLRAQVESGRRRNAGSALHLYRPVAVAACDDVGAVVVSVRRPALLLAEAAMRIADAGAHLFEVEDEADCHSVDIPWWLKGVNEPC